MDDTLAVVLAERASSNQLARLAENGPLGKGVISFVLTSRSGNAKAAVIRRAAWSDSEFDYLASSQSLPVRAALADHFDAPTGILLKLSSDDSAVVRKTVAGNARTPADVLTRLSLDRDLEVQRTALHQLALRG